MVAAPVIKNGLTVFDNSSILDGDDYLDCRMLFFSLYGKIPCYHNIRSLDHKKVREWIEQNLEDQTVHKYYSKHFNPKKKRMEYENLIVTLKNELIIEIDLFRLQVLFAPESEAEAQQLIFNFAKFPQRTVRHKSLYLLVHSTQGIDTRSLKINKPKIDFSINYNSDLLAFHKDMLDKLNRKGSGLFLLYGNPGTGKSTYIRYLVQYMKEKVIFMPPRLAGNLDMPEFTAFLLRNEDAIFVIEDAEDLIVSRDRADNSSISMLLNLTDGLLGEALSIKVIATFNTKVDNIDTALLRKGRLKGAYEFKELCVDRSRMLLQKLGFENETVYEPMTLADIYYIKQAAMNLQPVKKAIGFTAA